MKYAISYFRDLWNDKSYPEGSEILLEFLHSLADGSEMDDPFFSKALEHIRKEVGRDLHFTSDSRDSNLREYWSVFFPEGDLIDRNFDDLFEDIRLKRSVVIDSPVENPLKNIPSEMTFTSNVLLTLPDSNTPKEKLDLPSSILNELPAIEKEEQLYWFDHPVQLGEIPEKNEIIYGLKGLSQTFSFEKAKGTVEKDSRLDVLLSVSVTHKGLQKIAADYLEYELSKCDDIKDLNIYIFTEEDSLKLLNCYSENSSSLSKYFGVDGKYGRHYNFLKAVNSLWKLSINHRLKGTFKIDLDQVFPQEELVSYTGKTAFEHFQSPLWGATGTDSSGNKVDLSMIAGALVNESDISRSLYTPDVSIPDTNVPLSDLAFFKHLTMSLSTRAEMGTRYAEEKRINGEDVALSRIHVTGGTNGILIDALHKYRPFTPAFIGRAEDQAYILSVLNAEGEKQLRYYHEDGLVMRHDKHAFAGQSIEAAKDGTYIADVLRGLYFSYYAEALPGGSKKTKESTYPFTGSYISEYPMTIAYMRFVYKLLEMYEAGLQERADALLELGKERIADLMKKFEKGNFLIEEFNEERDQWDLFYSEIEKLEEEIKTSETSALEKQTRLKNCFNECRVI